jgi:hypothetical protein
MLTDQQSAAKTTKPLPRTAVLLLHATLSGQKSRSRPAMPTATPAAYRTVTRSRRNRKAAGATQSGVV